MSGFVFYLTLPIIYGISILPFWILYRISDLLYVLLYYVLGYRKQIVFNNMKQAFPEKDDREIIKIRKQFFRYLCDFILEIFKLLTLSASQAKKRCPFVSDAALLLDRLYDQGKSIIIVLGHFGNWELGSVTFCTERKHPFMPIYKPLRNNYFDHLLLKLRTRYGAQLIKMKDTYRVMVKQKKQVTATAFLADQSPPPENAYWTTFLHQETAVFSGVELIARKFKFPVVYMSIKRYARGYYYMTAEILTDQPQKVPAGTVLELYIRRLEQDILEVPYLWLWSHRRWKHKK